MSLNEMLERAMHITWNFVIYSGRLWVVGLNLLQWFCEGIEAKAFETGNVALLRTSTWSLCAFKRAASHGKALAPRYDSLRQFWANWKVEDTKRFKYPTIVPGSTGRRRKRGAWRPFNGDLEFSDLMRSSGSLFGILYAENKPLTWLLPFLCQR